MKYSMNLITKRKRETSDSASRWGLRKLIFILLVVFLIFCNNQPIKAFELFGHRFTTAPSILFYVDSTAMEYDESISYGFSFWNGHNSNVKID